MNVRLPRKFNRLIAKQVESGLYRNKSEVVRDAIRHMFIETDPDDSALLARALREARKSPRQKYVPGEFKRLVTQAAKVKSHRSKLS